MCNRATIAVLLFVCGQVARSETVPYDPNTMSFPVTPEHAMSAARTWAGDPGLEFELLGVEDFREIGWYPYAYNYMLDSADHTQHFEVDCNTGEVMNWNDHTGFEAFNATDRSENPPPKLPEEELGQIARQFVAGKYADFEQLNMQPESYRWFCRRLPNGVRDCGYVVCVNMNTYTGGIYTYSAYRWEPLTISPDPTIDEATADSISLTAFDDDPRVKSVFFWQNVGLWVDRDHVGGVQRLMWGAEVVWSEYENYTLEMYLQELELPFGTSGHISVVGVDAHTGEVFWRGGGYLGSGGAQVARKQDPKAAVVLRSSKSGLIRYEKAILAVNGNRVDSNTLPRIIGGHPYLYVRQLTLLGCKVAWKNGRVVVQRGREIQLAPTSIVGYVNGEPTRFVRTVKILFGRAYVPLSTLQALFGNTVTWDQNSHKLDVRPQFSETEKAEKGGRIPFRKRGRVPF